MTAAADEAVPSAVGDDFAAAREVLRTRRPLLLVLDFDGVLAEIVDDPDAAALLDGMEDVVAELCARDDVTVCVSSGRGLADLSRRVPEHLRDRGTLLVGGHGTAAHLPGEEPRALFDLATARATIDDVVARLGEALDGAEGWEIERKDASVAVHYRRADPRDRDERLQAVRDLFARAREEPPGWTVLDGKEVVELRPAGTDKGRAVSWLLDEVVPDHVPVAIGDDVTDEDSFRVALQHDGAAVLVADEDRPTLARWRIPDPDAVLRLLRAVVDD